MNSTLTLSVVLSFVLLANALAETVVVDCLSLSPNERGLGAHGTLPAECDDFGAVELTVVIRDGRSGKLITPSRERENGFSEFDDRLSVRQTFGKAGNHIRWQLNFTNNSDQQRWLHVRWNATPETQSKTSFFDGIHYLNPCTVSSISKDKNISVPLAVVHREKSGLAFGVHPNQILSYIEEGAVLEEPNLPEYFFGTKLVLDPHQSETVDLVIFGFKQNFGYLDAFQRYYDEFPETFSVQRPGIDPRVTHAGCDYRAWIKNEPETVRRFGGHWDWCLNSFVHRGDWKVTKEYWEAGRENGSKRWNVTAPWAKVDAWAKLSRKNHERGEFCDAAMLFFMTTALTDIDAPKAPLKDKFWPEAYAGDGGTYHYCYPWGENNYAKHSLQSLGECIEETAIAGIAMDTANSSLKHYGAGIEGAPGRAYDSLFKQEKKVKKFARLEDGTRIEVVDNQQGVYSRINVGSVQLMDYLHSLEKGKFKLGLSMNGPGWMQGFRCDTVLVEHNPSILPETVWTMRLYCGQKVFSWWDDLRLYKKIDCKISVRRKFVNPYAPFLAIHDSKVFLSQAFQCFASRRETKSCMMPFPSWIC